MARFYSCDANSETGKHITAFWEAANKAAEAAEAWAKKAGTSAYIQPVQYFEGGVDYCEFDYEPNPEIWRKKEFDTTDGDKVTVYEPNVDVLPVKRKKDGEVTWVFVANTKDKKCRKEAVALERSRMDLPVVKVEAFYETVNIVLPEGGPERKRLVRNVTTPVFFRHEDIYYIKVDMECQAKDLCEVTSEIFDRHKRIALDLER